MFLSVCFRGGFEQDVENGYQGQADTCHGEADVIEDDEDLTFVIRSLAEQLLADVEDDEGALG